MNRFFYTLLLYLLLPVIGLYFFYRGFHSTGYWKNLVERLGFFEPEIPLVNNIHLHCASVGEVKAAVPLIISIVTKHPDLHLVITTTTPTGRAEIVKLINELAFSHNAQSATQVCYFPVDWPGACQRFLDSARPTISLLIETELWPNFINQCERRHIPVLLVNARMSDASLNKYLRFKKLTLPMFAALNWIAAQYESDEKNFHLLGCEKDRISVVGSIKFDINICETLIKKQRELKNRWRSNRPCWIAASIHPGEFDAVLSAHQTLLVKIPNLLLIAAPRHPEQFAELKKRCAGKQGFFVSRSEQLAPSADHSVVIGDTMGELMLMFGAADVAFVGGSLIARGGHNPIEPAACGLPVIMGASDYNFTNVCKMMESAGALFRVKDEQQLAKTIGSLLNDDNTLKQKSNASKQFVQGNNGSIDRLMAVIGGLIEARSIG